MVREAQALVLGVGEGLDEEVRNMAFEAVKHLGALPAGGHHPRSPQNARCLEVVLWGSCKRWAKRPTLSLPSRSPKAMRRRVASARAEKILRTCSRSSAGNRLSRGNAVLRGVDFGVLALDGRSGGRIA